MLMVFFFLIGAALGSFSLVLAWRSHSGKDWIRGRSECDHCHKTLEARDMIPVFSWLALGGRCRYCKKKLPLQLLLAELGLGLVAAGSYVYWPHTLNNTVSWVHFSLWLVILALLSALFWFDLRWFQLPTSFMNWLIGLGALEAVLELIVTDKLTFKGLVASIFGALLCGSLFWILSKFKTKAGQPLVGDGDAILGVGLGLIAGSPAGAFILIFSSSIIGTIISVPLLLSKTLKLKSLIPFGPLLITSAVIVQLFGERLSSWYLNFIGL